MFGTKPWIGLLPVLPVGLIVALGWARGGETPAESSAPPPERELATPEFDGPAEDLSLDGDDATAAAASAWPRRYRVDGEDLAGELELHEDGRVRVRGRTFGGKHAEGEPFAFSGSRADDGGVLLEQPLEPKKGLRYFLDGLDGERDEPEPVRTSLKVADDGTLAGTLLGRDVHATPAADTDDVIALVIPGLSTNIWNQYGIPYLDENLGVFAAYGIAAERVAINTEAGVAENAATIAAAIRAAVERGQRVLLFAHSKGGADTVTALSDPANRDLLPHVAGFVAIQPVYAGARISDGIESGELIEHIARIRSERIGKVAEKAVRKVTDAAFEHLLPLINRKEKDGSAAAWRDLRSADRQAALAEHPFPVEQVPTVTIRSSMSGRKLLKMQMPDGERKFRMGKNALRTPLVVFQRFVTSRYGEANDGMVSLEAQAIPGALADVVYEDLDHFEPGVRGESAITPTRLTQDALDRVLPRLKPAVAARD